MNFKYYDTLSILVSGIVLLFALSVAIDLDISKYNVAVLLALAYVLGYVLNAISAFAEPFYFWCMGGKPSDNLLKDPNPTCCGKTRNYTGYGRIRFYEYERARTLLWEDLNDRDAKEGKLFDKAMSYSNPNENTRVPDFNAQYAFSRVMLTLIILSAVILLFKYYTIWWVWFVAVGAIYIVGRRCKERGYYYAKEVLVEYLKSKNK